MNESVRRLRALGIDPDALSAIVVTHEHADHLGGVARLARRHAVPVWLTNGTYAAWSDREVPQVQYFDPHTPFEIGDLQLCPYPVPHDAREPAQLVIGDGAHRIGVLSDAGSLTPHMCHMLQRCEALMIEFNHDVDMLARGPYPPALQRRVGGDYGHLSNTQAAELLRRIDTTHLRHIVLTHLSAKNNTPALARAAGAAALNCSEDWLVAAPQDQGLDWREVY